jgi:hypothetical protein
MEKPKNRPAPDGESITGRRKPRRNSEVPHKADDEAGLETYEESPERPGSDIRSTQDTPDGPMPSPARPTSPD